MANPVVSGKTVRTSDGNAIDGTYRMLPGTSFGIYVRTAYSGWSNLQVRALGAAGCAADLLKRPGAAVARRATRKGSQRCTCPARVNRCALIHGRPRRSMPRWSGAPRVALRAASEA
jgi:hypothetical protein